MNTLQPILGSQHIITNMLIPKPDENSIRKETYRPILLINREGNILRQFTHQIQQLIFFNKNNNVYCDQLSLSQECKAGLTLEN